MWIARDESGELCLFKAKPIRGSDAGWFTTHPQNREYLELPPSLYPEITWENSPKEVKSIKIEV